MSFLPVLLPWSLDTAFLGTVFMLFGLLIRRINLENLNQKKLVIYCIVIIYILLAYFNPGINISVREYGKYGVLSIVLTIIIGVLGTSSYALVCKIFEDTFVVKGLALIGQNTILLLALHRFIFSIIDRLISRSIHNHYIVGLLGVLVSLLICQSIRIILNKTSFNIAWVKYLF